MHPTCKLKSTPISTNTSLREGRSQSPLPCIKTSPREGVNNQNYKRISTVNIRGQRIARMHPLRDNSRNSVTVPQKKTKHLLIRTPENRANSLREGVGEYSPKYSPYSRNKHFTPIFYPYARYLALFYIHRLDPAVYHIPHSHSIVSTTR